MQSGKIGHFDVRFVKERIFMKTLKDLGDLKGKRVPVSYTHLDVYKRQEYIRYPSRIHLA